MVLPFLGVRHHMVPWRVLREGRLRYAVLIPVGWRDCAVLIHNWVAELGPRLPRWSAQVRA